VVSFVQEQQTTLPLCNNIPTLSETYISEMFPFMCVAFHVAVLLCVFHLNEEQVFKQQRVIMCVFQISSLLFNIDNKTMLKTGLQNYQVEIITEYSKIVILLVAKRFD
jgi:hypothetical protein